MAKVRFGRARLRLLAGLLVVAATIGLVTRASARIAGGAAKKPDCYSEFDGIDGTNCSDPTHCKSVPQVKCVDGDPCDKDGVCGNRSCTFMIRLCINQTDIPVCKPQPAGLTKLQVIPPKCQPAFTEGVEKSQSMCAPSFAPVVVGIPTKSKTRPGRMQLRVIARGKAVPTTDNDEVNLFCLPRTAPCPPTTTTTTSTTTTITGVSVTTTTVTTTSTTIPACRNVVH